MSSIPTKSREIVHRRDALRCGRCGARGQEISHRRPRGVTGGHPAHCPCNLIYACRLCAQGFAHGRPLDSLATGWTLSRTVAEPFLVPVLMWHGLTLLNCDGSMDEPREG